MIHAQESDPETLVLREQLLLLQSGGASKLKKQGVGDERLRYLQLLSIDGNDLLRDDLTSTCTCTVLMASKWCRLEKVQKRMMG